MHPLGRKTASERFVEDFELRINGLQFTRSQANRMRRMIAIYDRLPDTIEAQSPRLEAVNGIR